MQPLADWTRRVDALCREHLACDWHDLSGDHEPLERGWIGSPSSQADGRAL